MAMDAFFSNGSGSGIGRRALLGFAVAAGTLPWMVGGARADATADTPADAPADQAVATIQALNAALLTAMKDGGHTSFNQRFTALAPAIDQAFDLPAVLAVSVGPRWASLPADQKARLLAAFRKYTIASYVANFDSYSGQTFSVSPTPRAVRPGEVVVEGRITPTNGNATKLGYVMRQTPDGWRVVDVLADGSISRVAVQRSDFSSVLSSGGGEALLASLQRKTSDLSGGALA
jgi:phospholipid transport system substrate-binding protein